MGGAVKLLIDGDKKSLCQLNFEKCMLLKGAVSVKMEQLLRNAGPLLTTCFTCVKIF